MLVQSQRKREKEWERETERDFADERIDPEKALDPRHCIRFLALDACSACLLCQLSSRAGRRCQSWSPAARAGDGENTGRKRRAQAWHGKQSPRVRPAPVCLLLPLVAWLAQRGCPRTHAQRYTREKERERRSVEGEQ